MITDSKKLEFLRDAFFTEGEIKYFEGLLKDEKEMSRFCTLLSEDMHKIYERAMDLIERVERGEFTEKQMAKIEKTIAFYLAVQDNLQKELSKDFTKSDDSAPQR